MKLISLNTWGGRAGKEKLLTFFESHADVDMFCLQEIWSDKYDHLLKTKTAAGQTLSADEVMIYGKQEISQLLAGHRSFFRPHFMDNYGLFMLLKDGISILEESEIFVHKEKGYIPEGDVGNHARNLQYVTFLTESGKRTVINFHGLWSEGTAKKDTPDRLLQSDNIVAFLKKLDHPFIITGDFNLLPDTESLRKLEVIGLRNLIKEYGITSTRTRLYQKDVRFADYTLVSEGIAVKDFKVLPDEVSDHAPLYLEFT